MLATAQYVIFHATNKGYELMNIQSGNALVYSASKWTVRGLIQAVALNLAQYNINVCMMLLTLFRILQLTTFTG